MDKAALPFVSCLCLTYNRFPHEGHLLNEAVEAYLRQDYPANCRQLLILNDCPGQELLLEGAESACQGQNIHIINLEERLPTLHAKYNAATNWAAGHIYCWWDDDDICLPWRISQGVQGLGLTAAMLKEQDYPAVYYNTGAYWYMPHRDGRGEDGLPLFDLQHRHDVGPAFNAATYTRRAYQLCGPFRNGNSGGDKAMHWRMRAEERVRKTGPGNGVGPALHPSRWSYIYRWGVSRSHVSSVVGGIYPQRAAEAIEPGEYKIVPGWQRDYVRLITRTCRLRELL